MPKDVVVVSRKGCHLCENVIKALHQLASSHGFELTVEEISGNKELEARYLFTIPVVRIGGKDVFDARSIRPGADYLATMKRLLESQTGD